MAQRRSDARRRAARSKERILNAELQPGAIVAERYRIVAPLARGGFGAVYVAEQITTERRVALKVLVRHPQNMSVERLLAEARITTRLSSEHIVQVIDAGIDTFSAIVFVVMELLAGSTLEDLVQERGPCTPDEAAEFMRQIAVGLDKAHRYVDSKAQSAPIVHRDLKPSNVFVTQRDDGSPLVKILDFGTAKILSGNAQASELIRGTPQYMASEQAAGEAITPATDIWAFGLIAFYVLTGRSYWLAVEREGSQAQLFGEVLTLPLVPASARLRELGAPELGAEFDAWFSRCVNRDAAARFSSAGLAASELRRALNVSARSSRPSETRHVPPQPWPEQPAPDRASSSRTAAPLVTQDHAALATTHGFPRARSSRTRLATLMLVLVLGAVAASALVWNRRVTPEAVAPATASGPASPTSGSPALSASAALNTSPALTVSPALSSSSTTSEPSPTTAVSTAAAATKPAATPARARRVAPAAKKQSPAAAAPPTSDPAGSRAPISDVYEQR